MYLRGRYKNKRAKMSRDPLVASFPYPLVASYPYPLAASYPNSLAASYPNPLVGNYPYPLLASYPYPLAKSRTPYNNISRAQKTPSEIFEFKVDCL